MVDKRFVCKYPQYSFCGAFDCRLSKYCSLYPIYYLKSYERGYHNPIKKTPEERKQHNQNYILYNTLFSNYKEKNKMIQRRWYENNDACKARNKKYREKHKKELKDYFHHRTQLYSYKMSRRKDISICTYPQYECCGYKKCNLYHICSQLKITNKTTDEIILEKNGQVSE